MKIEDAIQQYTYTVPVQKTILNLMYTHAWLKSMHQKVFSPFGINGQHYNILRILKGRYPKPAHAGELKAVMLDKSPDVTRLIDKLEKRSLVKRVISKENRRKRNITITQKGLDLLKAIDPVLHKHYADLNRLSNQEMDTLNELLDKFRPQDQ